MADNGYTEGESGRPAVGETAGSGDPRRALVGSGDPRRALPGDPRRALPGDPRRALPGDPRRARIPILGLLGGVASGKSLVADCLEQLGAAVLDADGIGHEVLRLEEVREAVRQRWGQEVFGPDGQVDRKALAKIVFDPSPTGREALQYLEQLTHPKIGQLLSQEAMALAATGRYKALVLDAPVMLKAGWHTLCDHLLFVDAPREARLARAQARGWTEADFTAREAAQESLDVKRRHADAIIDNSGSTESTQAQVRRLWHSLIG